MRGQHQLLARLWNALPIPCVYMHLLDPSLVNLKLSLRRLHYDNHSVFPNDIIQTENTSAQIDISILTSLSGELGRCFLSLPQLYLWAHL